MDNAATDAYGMACFGYFCLRYHERLVSLGLDPYRLPPDIALPGPLKWLPYLLNDKEFYQGRLYASTTLLDVDPPQHFHLGRVLWEMGGLDPAELIVLCDSIRHPQSKFPALYRHHLESWLSSFGPSPAHGVNHDSLQDFESFMQRWPEDGSCQTQATVRHLFIPKLKNVLRGRQGVRLRGCSSSLRTVGRNR